MNEIVAMLECLKIENHRCFDLSQISSIKIGGRAELVVFPKTEKELERVLFLFFSKKIFFKIVGNASNLLFVSNVSYPLVITSKMIDEIQVKKNLVSVSAGTSLPKFVDTLRKNKFTGMEGLSGIPATIGGAIFNNAGAFGQNISDNLVKIKVFSRGRVFEIYKNEIKFGYHFSNLENFVILSATFLFENASEYDIISLVNKFAFLRSKSQPAGPSLGSVYKKINGKSAGFYIERCGLKGQRVGGVMISNKHANFFVNEGGASATDFLRLSTFVQNAVLRSFGLELACEIEKVGDNNEIISRFPYSY